MDVSWCRDVDWGSAPAWVGAIGSVLAFSLAVRIYWLNSTDRRKEQARLVSFLVDHAPTRVTASGTTIEKLRSATPPTLLQVRGGRHYDVVGDVHVWALRIRNLSKESIGFVEGEIVDSADHEIVRFLPFGMIGPESDEEFTLVSEYVKQHATGFKLKLRFSDASGRRWARDHFEPVRELRGRQSTPRAPSAV